MASLASSRKGAGGWAVMPAAGGQAAPMTYDVGGKQYLIAYALK